MRSEPSSVDQLSAREIRGAARKGRLDSLGGIFIVAACVAVLLIAFWPRTVSEQISQDKSGGQYQQPYERVPSDSGVDAAPTAN